MKLLVKVSDAIISHKAITVIEVNNTIKGTLQ